MPYYISPPPQGPLARIVTAIVAVFALVGAFMIGIAAFLVVGAIALIVGLAIWLRVIWIKRQLRKSGVDLGANSHNERSSAGEAGRVIDAEYTVVSDNEDENEK